MENNFKPIFRSILKSKQFENPFCLKIWIWCLLSATDKPYETLVGMQTVKLKPGQFIFGRKKAAERLKMSESKIYRWINYLKNDGSLSIKTNNKFSIISILNWHKYQLVSNNKRTTSEQQVNTNNKDNKDIYMCANFEKFWKEYPKRKNKLEASDVWERLNPSKELTEKIIKAVIFQRSCDDWTREKGKYIPLPNNWLKDQRWEDEPEVKKETPKNFMIG